MDDPVLNRIKSGWSDAIHENSYKDQAKWLRLLVNHVKTPEGIPSMYQPCVREWSDILLGDRGHMETRDACQAVSAIDHARKKLDSTKDFGAGLKTELSGEERRRIAKQHKPLVLRRPDAIEANPEISSDPDDI